MADEAPVTETVVADAAPVESAPVESSEPEVTADTFGWDSWDGKDEALPETVRPWATRLGEHHMRTAKAAQDEADRIAKVYESLMAGQEHPELTELKTKYETEQKTWTQQRAEHDALKADYESYKKSVENWHQAQLQEKVDAFAKENAWMFENEEIQALGGELIDEGFDPYTDLPVIMRLPEPVRERAREVMKELAGAKNAGPKAIQLARAEVRLPAQNQSADLVNGTETRIANKVTEPTVAGDASLADIAANSIRRTLRAVK